MVSSNLIFWNVDTQVDFIEQGGKLFVPDAYLIKPIWNKLTRFAKDKNIQVINTADYHYINSAEIDKEPDMVNTFPEHCMAGSNGAKYIEETNPDEPTVFFWDREYIISNDIKNTEKHRNIVLLKDSFDVFAGNPHTDRVLGIIDPDEVYVYGVTTNICVDYVVTNLVNRVSKVYVISDAIRELPQIPLPYEKWDKLGVEMISSDKLFEKLD